MTAWQIAAAVLAGWLLLGLPLGVVVGRWLAEQDRRRVTLERRLTGWCLECGQQHLIGPCPPKRGEQR